MTTSILKLFASKKSVYYYAQKSLRIVWVRKLLGQLVALLVPARPMAPLQAHGVENLQQLRHDGVAFTQWAQLTRAQLALALEFLDDKPLYTIDDYEARQHPVLISQPEAARFGKLHHASKDVAQCNLAQRRCYMTLTE